MYEKKKLLHRVTNPYQKNRQYNQRKPQNEGVKRLFRHAFPFAQAQTPRIRRQNNGGHVQNPRTCPITKFAFAHAVEEKLEKPHRSRKTRKKDIFRNRRALICIVTKRFVLKIEVHTPNKICRQAPPQ